MATNYLLVTIGHRITGHKNIREILACGKPVIGQAAGADCSSVHFLVMNYFHAFITFISRSFLFLRNATADKYFWKHLAYRTIFVAPIL